MFLHLLNERQQRAFLGLARQFIEVDRHMADEEQNLLELMRAEMGLPFDEEIPAGEIAALAPAFDTRQARAAALLEIIGVGHADESFHPEESAFVRTLAAAFGIGEEEVTRMETWVRRQLELAQEAEAFWS